MEVRIQDSLAYRLHRTARLLRKHFLDLARREGLSLTPEQWFVLNKLRQQDGQTQSELGESIFSDRPNMTRMLQKMESEGLVVRREDADDARCTRVFLTSNGKALEASFARIVPSARGRIFKDIKADDIDRLKETLRILENNLEKDMA